MIGLCLSKFIYTPGLDGDVPASPAYKYNDFEHLIG